MIFIYLIDRAFLGLMVLEMLAKVVFEMHAFLNLSVLEMPCLYTTMQKSVIQWSVISKFTCIYIYTHLFFSNIKDVDWPGTDGHTATNDTFYSAYLKSIHSNNQPLKAISKRTVKLT